MSLLRHYVNKLDNFSGELEGRTTPRSLSILDDLLRRQYIGFNVGNSNYLEFAGPRGPNLSPTPLIGGKDYMGRPHDKPRLPGYSMKYTFNL